MCPGAKTEKEEGSIESRTNRIISVCLSKPHKDKVNISSQPRHCLFKSRCKSFIKSTKEKQQGERIILNILISKVRRWSEFIFEV